MQGYTLDGMYRLAHDFPASLNTEDDPSQIKPYESPECYGIDCTKEGRLATGSIPTGTTRDAPTVTISSTEYKWYYNRLWRAAGPLLYWGAPFYDAVYFPHGLGKVQVGDGDTIVDFMPCFKSQMWVLTAGGSYFIGGASNHAQDDFQLSQYVQELKTGTASYAMTLNGDPVVANSDGVFMWNGSSVKELTKPVRSSLGSFTNVAIKADYELQKIIGTSKFVIDGVTGKLFDYGTSGFRYTTPTMKQAQGNSPFIVNSIVIAYEMITAGSATISWQSKAEDGDWVDETDIEIVNDIEGNYSRKEMEIINPVRAAHKYSFRITSMDSNVAIEEILVNVAGLVVEAVAE